MPSGFDSSDLDSLFETDGVGAQATIIGPPVAPPHPPPFPKTINVIFDLAGEAIDAYGNTDVDADNPSMLCKSTDLEGVEKGHTVTFDLQPHEDGYAKVYKVIRFQQGDGPQTTKVTLKGVGGLL